MTSKVTYLGELRTSSIHLQSGSEIITDAPTDNHGKGEAFSPTDMVANSLATCMLSFMGIKANELKVNLEGSTAEVTKTMAADPRRIAKIEVIFNMKSDADEKSRVILERVARTCAVGVSLHPDVVQDVTFNW
jgi:putative redox protein